MIGSEDNDAFEKAKTSIKDTVTSQTVVNTHYGVIQYGDTVTPEILLDKFTNVDNFESDVGELKWGKIGTLLNEGIVEGHKMLQEDGRDSARKLLVVYSDKEIKANVSDLGDTVGSARDDNVQFVVIFFGEPTDGTTVSKLNPEGGKPIVIDGKDSGTEIKKKILTGNRRFPLFYYPNFLPPSFVLASRKSRTSK